MVAMIILEHQQYGPPRPPSPQPSRWHVRLITGAAIAVSALTVTAAFWARIPISGHAVAAPDPILHIGATAVIPTIAQIKQKTLLDLKYVSAVLSEIPDNPATTPTLCAASTNPSSKAGLWRAANSVGKQHFTDGTQDLFHNSAFIAVGVFDDSSTATKSFITVANSLNNCHAFTNYDRGGSDGPDYWTITDTHQWQSGRLSWSQTQDQIDDNWKCGKAYEVQGNLAVYTISCGANPADRPTALADLVIANANATTS